MSACLWCMREDCLCDACRIDDTLAFDRAWHFSGVAHLPPAFVGARPPHKVTLAQLSELMCDYAILFHRVDGQYVIAFDTHRGRFRSR